MANGDITTPKKNMVETKQIALLFGLTVRRIQQLTQDGILQTEMVGRQRKYDLLGSVRRYIEYLQKRVSEKGTAPMPISNKRKRKWHSLNWMRYKASCTVAKTWKR